MNRLLVILLYFLSFSSQIIAQDYLNELLEPNGYYDLGREIQILGNDLYVFTNFVSDEGVVGVLFRKLNEEGEVLNEHFFHESIEDGSGTITTWLDGLIVLEDGNLIYTVTNNADSWFIKMDEDLNIIDSTLVHHPVDPDERFVSLSLKNTVNGIMGVAYTEGAGFSQASLFTLEDDLTVSNFIPNVIYQHDAHIRDFKVLNDGHLLISGKVFVPTEDPNFPFMGRSESFIAKIDVNTGDQIWYHTFGVEDLNFSAMLGAELPNGNILSFLPWSTSQNGVDENALYQDFQSRLITTDGMIIDSTTYFSTFKGIIMDVRYNDGKVYCHGQKLGPNNNSKDSYFLVTDIEGKEINMTSHSHIECWGCTSESFHMDFKENGNVVGFGTARLDTLDYNFPLGHAWLFETDCQGRTETPEEFLGDIDVSLNNNLTELSIESDSLLWLIELDWYVEDTFLTSHEYNFTVTGEYELGQEILVEGRYCNEQFSIAIELTDDMVGVNERQSSKKLASVYPNPTRDNITVSAPEHILLAVITDMSGKEVIKKQVNKNQARLNVESLSQGMYQLRLVFKDHSEVHQLLIL